MAGAKAKDDKLPKCGIVMPISECDGCSEAHWQEVQTLIKRSAEKAGFDATLVSEADDAGVIQKRIVQNLYACPVAVCDISGRNANVMFELGMRLAFDKPTIIIKDDRTPFSFDTSPVEHVTYPRDLRFSKMEAFQEQLSKKIKKSAASDGDDSFLKSFGSFKVADISVEKAPIDELLLDEVSLLKSEMRHIRQSLLNGDALKRPFGSSHRKPFYDDRREVVRFRVDPKIGNKSMAAVDAAMSQLQDLKAVTDAELVREPDEVYIDVGFDTVGYSDLSRHEKLVRRIISAIGK